MGPNLMRMLPGATLAVLLLALPVAGQTHREIADEDAELVALDRQRDRVIAGLRAFAAVDSLSFEPVQVVRQGETAVVFSRILIHGALMGPLGRLPKLATLTVYTRKGSEWTVVSRALTPCDPRAVERGLC